MNRTEVPIVPESAYVLYKEAGQWTCVGLDFKGVFESPYGLGKSAKKAIRAYQKDVVSLLEDDETNPEEEEKPHTWNNRLLYHPPKSKKIPGWYAIHEVFYQGSEITGWGEAQKVIGDTLQEIQESIQLYLKAVSQPVLVEVMEDDEESTNLVDWDTYNQLIQEGKTL